MTEYPYEVLADAPLEVGSIYKGPVGDSHKRPLNALFAIGSQKGIRYATMKDARKKKKGYGYVVILSNGKNKNWDEDIKFTVPVTYFGDNTTPGADVASSHGNALFKECSDLMAIGRYEDIPPFLFFTSVKKEDGKNSNNVMFCGVGVPGTIHSEKWLEEVKQTVDGGECMNYKATFTLLNVGTVDRDWLNSRLDVDSGHEDLAPVYWKEYCSGGLGNVSSEFLYDQVGSDVAPESDVDETTCVEGDARNFFEYLSDEGLFYSTRIVEDFLLSLKAKQFLILSGGSGTGKTRMAQAYCRFRAAGSYDLVPVGSNWTDNRNMMGYMNVLSGKYVRTPVLDLIMRAESSDEPHVLILDEMNLSHVERYFSDFLSAMESHEPVTTGSNDPDVPGTVPLDHNLFVIGTVNMDETTYAFSPKVLDRANVIEFEPASVNGFLNGTGSGYDPSGDVGFLQDCMAGIEVRELTAPMILEEFKRNGVDDEDIDGIVSALESIQGCMRSMRLSFGYRTLDELMRFMYVAWVYEGKGSFKWRRYLDSQVMQKVLPKIHGNTSIRDGLQSLRTVCDACELNRSADKLARMADTLDNQRYVSFNC